MSTGLRVPRKAPRGARERSPSYVIEGDEKSSVTFEAPADGSYTFVCTFPEHYKGGMKGTLTTQ